MNIHFASVGIIKSLDIYGTITRVVRYNHPTVWGQVVEWFGKLSQAVRGKTARQTIVGRPPNIYLTAVKNVFAGRQMKSKDKCAEFTQICGLCEDTKSESEMQEV